MTDIKIAIAVCREDNPADVDEAYGKGTYARMFPDDRRDFMICDVCHKEKPDVSTRLDPFLREIHNEEIEVDICDDCYQNRCDDI